MLIVPAPPSPNHSAEKVGTQKFRKLSVSYLYHHIVISTQLRLFYHVALTQYPLTKFVWLSLNKLRIK
jgi:hypothetical protein